jgi:hypothetical protein
MAKLNGLRVILTHTSTFTKKDQIKADISTCFIGRGSATSSTKAYMKCFGELANKGVYTEKDVVFVSAEGGRPCRFNFDKQELLRAMLSGATLITDDSENRNRPFNVGEREVVDFIKANGYEEVKCTGEFSTWKPVSSSNVK